MSVLNGKILKEIDDILYGINEYYFRTKYGIDEFLSVEKYVHTFNTYRIMFDLEGGAYTWFENRGLVLHKDREYVSVMNVLYTQILMSCSTDGFNEESISDQCKMMKLIIDSGIYDRIFLCNENEERALYWWDKISSDIEISKKTDENIDFEAFESINSSVVERIKKAFRTIRA